MNRKSFELLFILVYTIIAIGVIALDVTFTPLRLLFVLPLLFILPGYALVGLMTTDKLGFAEHLTLSMGLSTGLAVLGGLLLHLVGLGLQTDAWVSFLGSITLVATAGTLHRSYRNQDAETQQVDRQPIPVRSIGMVALALLLVVGAFQVARWGATNFGQSRFTQLWMTPMAATAEQQIIQFGVHNQEAMSLHYRLQLKVNDTVAQEWTNLALAPDQIWETTVALPLAQLAEGELAAYLYREDMPDNAYRYVVWKTK